MADGQDENEQTINAAGRAHARSGLTWFMAAVLVSLVGGCCTAINRTAAARINVTVGQASHRIEHAHAYAESQLSSAHVESCLHDVQSWDEDARGRGGRVQARDQDRMTALHHAARVGNVAAVQLLLRHGADVNAIDLHRQTPLDCARNPIPAPGDPRQQCCDLLVAGGGKTVAELRATAATSNAATHGRARRPRNSASP